MSTEPIQPENYLSVYRRAFKEYGGRALWNVRQFENPSPEDALAIRRQLREERVARAAEMDSEILQANGLEVTWLRREPAIYT